MFEAQERTLNLTSKQSLAAIKKAVPRRLRVVLASIDRLLAAAAAPPKCEGDAAFADYVAAKAEAARAEAEERGAAFFHTAPDADVPRPRFGRGGLKRLACEQFADVLAAASLARLAAAATLAGDAEARAAALAVAGVIGRTVADRCALSLTTFAGPSEDVRLRSVLVSGAARCVARLGPAAAAANLRRALRLERRAPVAAGPEGASIATVLFSGVQYYTGQVRPPARDD